jgi:hypothetical protein
VSVHTIVCFVPLEVHGCARGRHIYLPPNVTICKEINRVLAFKEAIASEFAIHDLGEVKDFLGCQVVRDSPNRRLFMSSTMKIDALVESFD